MNIFKNYLPPSAVDPTKVGDYPSEAYSGGGYFYDDVLEYRVWTKESGRQVYYAFAEFEEALSFSKQTTNAKVPVVLVRQNSYIEEDRQGRMKHIHKERITEWQVDWLKGTNGTHENIPQFIAKNSK